MGETTRIRRQLPCYECGGKGETFNYPYHGSVDKEHGKCHECNGTGRGPIETTTVKVLVERWQGKYGLNVKEHRRKQNV